MEAGNNGERQERRNPTRWRMVRTRPLMMEMDRAVFTMRTQSIPSEGAGRLESPMLIGVEDSSPFSLGVTKMEQSTGSCQVDLDA